MGFYDIKDIGKSHFCIKNVTLDRESIVTGGWASSGLSIGGGSG